jgi:hypothetical protein
MTSKRTPSPAQRRAGDGRKAPGSARQGGSRPASAKGQTPAQQRAARKQAAAQRALAAQRGQRRRWLVVGGAIAAVVVVVGVLVGLKVSTGSGKPASGGAATVAASPQVVAAVAGVPASVLDQVGAGTVASPPKALTGPPLTADGKPRVLYVGAEYCPYCAAERWSLAVALSRFGTLTGLGATSSSPTDVYPNTATLSFHGAGYRSDVLSLTAKEIESNQPSGNGYAPLDTLDPADATLFRDVGQGAFPFIDIGGRYAISGASYDPTVLQGRSRAQIAAALSDPASPIAKGVDGTANVITAALCRLTANQPGGVCTSAGVTAAAKLLPAGG